MTLDKNRYEDMIMKATSFEQESTHTFMDALKLSLAPALVATGIFVFMFWPAATTQTTFEDELQAFNAANDYIMLEEMMY